MHITPDIDAAPLNEAELLARERGLTLSEFVEEALQRTLSLLEAFTDRSRPEKLR